MINEKALKAYLLKEFKGVHHIGIRKLGSGVQGSGFLIELQTAAGQKSYVVKTLMKEGLGHDYPSDRAAVFLLDLDEYKTLPRHVKAIDVLSELDDGSIKSIGGGREYYLLMEQASGKDYFKDLIEFSRKERLYPEDKDKIKAMTSYLAKIHSVKKDSKTLYWRKLRDTVGHGECLMGVLDTYPDGFFSSRQMAEIIKKSVDWIYALKHRYVRLSQIHGDFHPGNIWFQDHHNFTLLDRSRGPWGEPADDITALTINYIFFSIKNHESVKGAYSEGLTLFFEEYIKLSADKEITKIVAPFFAFRGVVVANPVFYPDLTMKQRKIIFKFINNILDNKSFNYKKINNYLQ